MSPLLCDRKHLCVTSWDTLGPLPPLSFPSSETRAPSMMQISKSFILVCGICTVVGGVIQIIGTGVEMQQYNHSSLGLIPAIMLMVTGGLESKYFAMIIVYIAVNVTVYLVNFLVLNPASFWLCETQDNVSQCEESSRRISLISFVVSTVVTVTVCSYCAVCAFIFWRGIRHREQPTSSIDTRSSEECGDSQEMEVSLRNKIYRILEGGWHPWDVIVECFILSLVLGNIILFILSTEQSLTDRYGHIIDILEIISIALFTIEFLLRMWVCVEKRRLRRKSPIKARLLFLLKPLTMLDMLCVVPFWIFLFIEDIPLHFAFFIRVLRIFRLFKAEKYTHTMRIMRAVVSQNRQTLLTTIFFPIILLVCTSTALYFAQYSTGNPKYRSIASTIYPTVLMLTNQGPPPREERQVTTAGMWVTSVSCVASVAIFAVPAGMLLYGFILGQSVDVERFERILTIVDSGRALCTEAKTEEERR
ncbi:Ion transport protein [Planoprotostelium fungivorum]|uniref:Ion transport protein n=1 Tax=Planoprotostelium fungivorum TaxID=1890364 RepID=A0A2P6NEC2_9EUKA|nr:Ion transport protein [Planoprotostelium fungivorum]